MLIGFVVILPTIIFAQSKGTPTIDKRLYEVFEADFLEQMQRKTPAMIEYYNFFLDHAYDIQTSTKKETSTYPEITINNFENINILKIITDENLKRDYHNQSIYQIVGTDKLLILIAEKELAKKFNQHTGRTH